MRMELVFVILLLPILAKLAWAEDDVKFETVTLRESEPEIKVQLAWKPGKVKMHPATLMLGSLDSKVLPEWSIGLVNDGYMLTAFTAAYPSDPDPARRPQWLYFDQRFAHSYPLSGYRAAQDARRVVDYLVSRGDVNREKIGWMGSSSTGIPGFSVVTQGPRLAAIVAFVSTGAYRQWLETWHTNKLWRGETRELWPETLELLDNGDPILHTDRMYPTAVLMVNGGEDTIVDPKTARAFIEAAKPHYKDDPERLRLVVYEGFGHNLPRDIIRMYTEHWFHLYMHPTNPAPKPPAPVKDLKDSANRTQINSAEHKEVTGAR